MIKKIVYKVEERKRKHPTDARIEIEETLSITAFVAAGIGARGTPAVFINNRFNPGYVPKANIEKLLK